MQDDLARVINGCWLLSLRAKAGSYLSPNSQSLGASESVVQQFVMEGCVESSGSQLS